jgi:hypothetical protein
MVPGAASAQTVDLRLLGVDGDGVHLPTSRVRVLGAASTGSFKGTPYPVSPTTFSGPAGGVVDVTGLEIISQLRYDQFGIEIINTDSVIVRSTGVTRMSGVVASGMAITVVLEPVDVEFGVKDPAGVQQGTFRVQYRKTGETTWSSAVTPPANVIYGPGQQVDVRAIDTANPGATVIGLGLTVADLDSITVTGAGATTDTGALSSGMAIIVELDLMSVEFKTVDGAGALLATGRLELSGATTTNGAVPTPFTNTMANGGTVDLEALDTATSTTFTSNGIMINRGDSISVTSAGATVFPGVVGNGAKVVAVLEDLDVELIVADALDQVLNNGEIRVGGAVVSNGFQPTPLNVSMADGGVIDVDGQLLGVGMANIETDGVTVSRGDSIRLTGGPPQIFPGVMGATAKVVVVYDLMSVALETVDTSIQPIAGYLTIAGGATAGGVSPQVVTVGGTSTSLDVSGSYLGESFGVSGLAIAAGDSIVIRNGTTVQVETISSAVSGGAKVQVVFTGDISVEYLALDGTGTLMPLGRVEVDNASGFNATPFSQTHGDGDVIHIEGLDTGSGATVSADVQVFEGDSIAVKSTGVERYAGVVPSGAKVAAILEAMSVELVTEDALGQFLADGRIKVTGEATSNDFEGTPLNMSMADSAVVDVEALLTGSSVSNILETGLTISRGDSIRVTDSGATVFPGVMGSNAKVVAIFDLMSVEVQTVDLSIQPLAGNVTIGGDATAVGAAPKVVVVGGTSGTLDVSGSFVTESYGVTGLAVAAGDSIVLRNGSPVQVETISGVVASGAKIQMVFTGTISVDYLALDENGSILVTGRVKVGAGGFDPTPYTLTHGDGDSINVQGLDVATNTTVSAGFKIFNGDSIAVKASGIERFAGVVTSGAKVSAILDVLSFELTTVDVGDNLLPTGRVEITGGYETNGFKGTPVFGAMADGALLDIETLLTGSSDPPVIVSGLQVNRGDSIRITQGAPQVFPGVMGNTARVLVEYQVMNVSVATSDTLGASVAGNVSISGAAAASGVSPQVVTVSAAGRVAGYHRNARWRILHGKRCRCRFW